MCKELNNDLGIFLDNFYNKNRENLIKSLINENRYKEWNYLGRKIGDADPNYIKGVTKDIAFFFFS